MRVFLIRHGKDKENCRGGWSKAHLTKECKEQVGKLAQYLELKQKDFNIEKIISSDLIRAKQTAMIINEKLNVKIEFTEKLREMNNGKLAGMSNEKAKKLYPNLYYNTLKMNEKYPDGESPINFYNRIIESFNEIVEKNNKYENIIVVTHGGVINIIYRYINNMEWSNKIKSIKIANASIYSLIIEKDKKYFELENYAEYLS